MLAPSPPQESLVCDGTRTSLPAIPSPNPDDAGPIVCRPMGLPVTAATEPGQTRISSGTASTVMQGLRPLRPLGRTQYESCMIAKVCHYFLVMCICCIKFWPCGVCEANAPLTSSFLLFFSTQLLLHKCY
jgi:hypothetical protein